MGFVLLVWWFGRRRDPAKAEAFVEGFYAFVKTLPKETAWPVLAEIVQAKERYGELVLDCARELAWERHGVKRPPTPESN